MGWMVNKFGRHIIPDSSSVKGGDTPALVIGVAVIPLLDGGPWVRVAYPSSSIHTGVL